MGEHSLLKKGLVSQKISGTRNHQCGQSATSGTVSNFVAIRALKLRLMKNFVKAMNQEEAAFTYFYI